MTHSPAIDREQGRPCLLGAVSPTHLASVQSWAANARVGDWLANPACALADVERDLKAIRNATQ